MPNDAQREQLKALALAVTWYELQLVVVLEQLRRRDELIEGLQAINRRFREEFHAAYHTH